MAQRSRKARHDLYAGYREASGWWLAAWRDYKGLTLEELADELQKSRGYVSDLETGASRPGRTPSRFNKDTVESVAAALGVTGGRLIDVNPFELDERVGEIESIFLKLDDTDREVLRQMAHTLGKRSAA